MAGRSLNTVTLRVDDRELMAALKMLESKLGRKTLTKAARRGAYLWQEEAKKIVTREFGTLHNEIKIKQRVNAKEIIVSVGTGKKAAHAHLVELGTAPHPVALPGQGKKGAKKQKHKPHKMVHNHPGSTPKPFLRPAFDRKKDAALLKVKQMLRKYIDQVTAKYGRGR